MSTGLLIGSIVAAVFVVIAAASAAAETAMTRISRSGQRVRPRRAPGAAALVEVLGERETTLAPLLLSRVAAHVGAITIVVTLVADRRSTGGVVIAAIGSAAALYIFAEAIPRIWALQHIDRAALRSARILRVLCGSRRSEH